MRHTLILLAVAAIAVVHVARAETAPLQESDAPTTRAINITVPSSKNPRDGIAVKIDSVIDKRDVDPYTVGEGRKKIIVLSSQTVSDLVEKAVTNGLRKAGFRVLREADPGYAAAAPLETTIRHFWARQLECHPCPTRLAISINVKGPVEPFSGLGLSFKSSFEKSTYWTFGPRFETVLGKAVGKIRKDIVKAVQGPATTAQGERGTAFNDYTRVISPEDSNLLKAAERGDLETVQDAMSRGADIDTGDKTGTTALMLASKRGHLDIAELLIRSGADVNAIDEVGKTALNYAGHRAISDLLLANGAATP